MLRKEAFVADSYWGLMKSQLLSLEKEEGIMMVVTHKE